ncbi:hypothetical protein [Streptomyces chumphonensis]|uniref:hypothetical protein n=1 Tax=Streptomyces chumphonensis TaxID=1214925 RepID=UPI003D71513E
MPYEYQCDACELTAVAIDRSAWQHRRQHRERVHDGLAPDDRIVHRRGLLGWVWLAGWALAAVGAAVVAVVVVRWWRGPAMRRVRATRQWRTACRIVGGLVLAVCVTAMVWVLVTRP